MIRILLSLLALSFIGLLSSCGGETEQQAPPVRFVVDSTGIFATFFNGQNRVPGNSYAKTERYIFVRTRDPVSGSVFASVDDTGNVFGSGISELQTGASGEYVLKIVGESDLAPGIYEGSLTISLCGDATCTTTYETAGADLPYTVTVLPHLAIQVNVADALVASLPTWTYATQYITVSQDEKIEIKGNLPIELSFTNQPGYYELLKDEVLSTETSWIGYLRVYSDAGESIYVEVRPSSSTGSSQTPYALEFRFR